MIPNGSTNSRHVAAIVLLGATACSDGSIKFIGSHEDASGLSGGQAGNGGASTSTSASMTPTKQANCRVGAVPARLGAESFYTKHADALGIDVLSSENVPDTAVTQACLTTNRMLAKRSDIRAEMITNGARIAVIAQDESLHDVPELADLSSDWNDTRGIGGSFRRPLTVAVEENLLCWENDVHHGEVIFVHSFAHAIRALGIARMDAKFDAALESAYQAALFDGKWLDAFASESFPQYWAEGVQSWFNANLAPPNRIHNEINTRAELAEYDPALYSIIAEYFSEEDSVLDCFSASEP